jgi:hypothetical protein
VINFNQIGISLEALPQSGRMDDESEAIEPLPVFIMNSITGI